MGRWNDVKAGGVSSTPHLQLPISGGPGLHATLRFAVVTTSASLVSPPAQDPRPSPLSSPPPSGETKTLRRKWDGQPCPPLKPKQVYTDARPLSMLPGEGRQHPAPRRGPPALPSAQGPPTFPTRHSPGGPDLTPAAPSCHTCAHPETTQSPTPRTSLPCTDGSQAEGSVLPPRSCPAGSLHPPSAATPPPFLPGPRGHQVWPQVTSRDTAVTPHLPGQPPSSVPCPSLKGGCPSCPILECSPLSTYPQGGPPPSSLTPSVCLWGQLSPQHHTYTHTHTHTYTHPAAGFRAASQKQQTPCLR